MNSRERMLKVIQGHPVDRVPVTLFIQDQGHFLNQMYPAVDPWDFDTLQFKVIELQRQYGVDIFLRVLFGLIDPLTIIFGGLDVSQQTDSWEVRTEILQHNGTRLQRSTIKTPEGALTQDFAITEVRPGTILYSCPKKPIKSPQDLELAIKYEPRMPADFPQKARERIQRLKTILGDDGILGSWSPYGPFNCASLLIDHEVLYSLFLTDYTYYERLMNFCLDRSFDYTRAIDAAGVDVHCIGGNVPGGFLGRQIYDEYVLPFERRYIEFVQQCGTPAIYHNCGQIMALVESYKGLGVKAVEPFSPPPLGDAGLARAKGLVNGDYTVFSGVDQVNVLQNGTLEQVKRQTEAQMKAGKPGGRFIMQNVDFLEYGTPPENVEAFVKTAKELADY